MGPQRATKTSKNPAGGAPVKGSWVSVEQAAETLSMSAQALRKALERRAVKVADGGVEACLDGVRGRKLGRLWRVQFSAAWGGEGA